MDGPGRGRDLPLQRTGLAQGPLPGGGPPQYNLELVIEDIRTELRSRHDDRVAVGIGAPASSLATRPNPWRKANASITNPGEPLGGRESCGRELLARPLEATRPQNPNAARLGPGGAFFVAGAIFTAQ
jgi:hypothetical protein